MKERERQPVEVFLSGDEVKHVLVTSSIVNIQLRTHAMPNAMFRRIKEQKKENIYN